MRMLIWLNEILGTFENPSLKLPVFIHCLSGKDRTGIVVGIILKLIGIPQAWIIEEYLLSDGHVDKGLITTAMNGIGEEVKYFNRINLTAIRDNLRNWLLNLGMY